MLQGFKDFIMKGNVLDLAVAVLTEIRDLLAERRGGPTSGTTAL